MIIMGQKWITEVLSDLRAFADQNGLPLLAHQLEVTASVARAEIASVEEGTPVAANVNANASQPEAITTGARSGHRP